MFLSKEVFGIVVENTPLVSIDLLVENKNKQILLGKRVNEPACNFWFVPGGRIFKNENLDVAFARIVYEELTLKMQRFEATFNKVYEHFYENNVFSDAFSTHYIALAHKIKIDTLPILNTQHSQYKWFKVEELLSDESVHNYTKDYFR